MSKISLFVRDYKVFDRKDGRHGQTLTVANDRGYSVEVSCVDREEFDFSKIPMNTTVDFDFKTTFRFVKAMSKNDKPYNYSFISIELVSCDDIEIE